MTAEFATRAKKGQADDGWPAAQENKIDSRSGSWQEQEHKKMAKKKTATRLKRC
jgi:hypothetical protein